MRKQQTHFWPYYRSVSVWGQAKYGLQPRIRKMQALFQASVCPQCFTLTSWCYTEISLKPELFDEAGDEPIQN
jgi:hypothetical protein